MNRSVVLASGRPESGASGRTSSLAISVTMLPSVLACVAPVRLTSGQKFETRELLVDRGAPADEQRADEHDRHRVEVEQRERRPDHVVGAALPHDRDLLRQRRRVVVADHAALRQPGGAAGVDEDVEVGRATFRVGWACRRSSSRRPTCASWCRDRSDTPSGPAPSTTTCSRVSIPSASATARSATSPSITSTRAPESAIWCRRYSPLYAVLIGTPTAPDCTAPYCATTASDEFSTRVAIRSPCDHAEVAHRVGEAVRRAHHRARAPRIAVDVEQRTVGIRLEPLLEQLRHGPAVAVGPDRRPSPHLRSEARTDLVDEQLGLLERGEVPAVVGLTPEPDVGEPALRPTGARTGRSRLGKIEQPVGTVTGSMFWSWKLSQ